MKNSAIVVAKNTLLIYDYVGGREDVNPDPYEVQTSSILCSLVLWLHVGYLWIYKCYLHLPVFSHIVSKYEDRILRLFKNLMMRLLCAAVAEASCLLS